jgi:hypothetical protein
MAFGQGEEIKAFERKFYTGVENFKVNAVSPSKDELEALYGSELQYTPDYVGTTKVSDYDGEREVPQVKVEFFLSNGSAEAEVKVKATFYIANTHHKSATNKLKVINVYGEDSWLEQTHIDNKTLPGNMQWYDNTGVKIAKRGEAELIDFLKNLLNVAYNNDKTVDKSKAEASIDDADWALIFKGDFSPIRRLVASTNNKVGLALGVKISSDGSMKQTVYTRKALRQWALSSTRADKFKWISKAIKETQSEGGLSQVDFGPEDLLFREFKLIPNELKAGNAPSAMDVFDTPSVGSDSDELDF